MASTQTEASSIAAEVKAGYTAAGSAAAGSGVKGPFGVELAPLPTGVSATLSCSLLGSGGTGTISYEVPSTTAIASGYTVSYTYNACSYGGYTFNGAVTLTYDRYVSPTDFAYTVSYSNFSVSGNGLANTTVSGKTSCNLTGGTASCYYNDGTRGWSSTMTYSNGTVNGTYAVNYGNGSVQVSYANFGATGGTATVTGSNGSKAVVTRTSATAFTVTITTSTGATAATYTVTL